MQRGEAKETGAAQRPRRWVRGRLSARLASRLRPPPRPGVLPLGAGRYELGPLLATGGMAELFLARRLGPGAIAHPVVVKRLLPEMQADPAAARAFLDEAWIASHLCHPNVVRFHDFVCHAGRYHLVLEHVVGCDLAAIQRARAGRPLPIREALEIVIALLRALGHAHATRGEDGRPLGLVHLDVSPHNVLLSREGEVKLTDFGVAWTTRLEELEELEGPRSVKGTPGYLAPEQLAGRPVDARTDLFAVGVVLFELLAGRRLSRGDSGDDPARSMLLTEVPLLSELRQGCPALLVGAVGRALAPSPPDRFTDAAEMEDALAEALGLVEERAAAAPGRGIAALVREAVG